jgi:hypothetical protein
MIPEQEDKWFARAIFATGVIIFLVGVTLHVGISLGWMQ